MTVSYGCRFRFLYVDSTAHGNMWGMSDSRLERGESFSMVQGIGIPHLCQVVPDRIEGLQRG